MKINKFSLNYIDFIYLCTRWINRRPCFPRQDFLAFNESFKVVLEAKLEVFLSGNFFELVGLHICIMSLILYFALE